MVHINNGILLSHKKEWNNAICSNMDATRDYHTKWSQKEKYHMISLICGIQNRTQMNLSMKQKQNHGHWEQTGGCQGGGGGGRDGVGGWG